MFHQPKGLAETQNTTEMDMWKTVQIEASLNKTSYLPIGSC